MWVRRHPFFFLFLSDYFIYSGSLLLFVVLGAMILDAFYIMKCAIGCLNYLIYLYSNLYSFSWGRGGGAMQSRVRIKWLANL